MTPSARSLLGELDRLPFPARNRLLADVARAGAGSAGLEDLLTQLLDGDGFSRRIALRLASVAVHGETVLRCLDPRDPDLAARSIAVAVRLRVGDDALCALEPGLAPALRSVLYAACRRNGRTDLAERLFPAVLRRWGAHDAAALLTACSSETVRSVLPQLQHAVTSWAALARRHPQVVLDFVGAQLATLPPAAWAGLWDRVSPGVACVASAEPARVLGLIERSSRRTGIPAGLVRSMATLARHDRQRVLRLVLNPRRPGAAPGGRRFWRAYADAPDSDLVALARVTGQHGLAPFLHTLPPRRRSGVYHGLLAGRDPVSAGLPLSVLDELPALDRHREAQRALALPNVAGDPDLRLRVTARLAWDAAGPALAQATRRPSAGERAAAYALYVAAASSSRDADTVGAMLASLDRLTNEQDLVRSAALSALAAVPTWLFREGDAAALRKLMADSMQARDKSWQTKTLVGDLARALVREGAVSRRPALVGTGLDGLEMLSQHISHPGLHGLNRDLPRGTEHLVLEAVRPRLAADAKAGRYGAALEFAEGLGRRAWALPDLQAFVDRARSAADDAVVRRAISLWLAPPETRDVRVQQVLRDDRSTITIPAVREALSYRRTDLLDDIFRRSLHGRFLKRDVRYVPTFRGCFAAWLPRQITAYAQLLVGVATAPGVPVHQVVSAVHILGRVPGTVADVRLFLDASEVPVQEAALGALAWSDDPAAVLPDLIARVDGDRARVAVYALSRCARFVPPAQLTDCLRPVLQSAKVTGRKEAARLLAEHRVAEAPALLGEAWSRPGQHRDVRRAVATAMRFLLDQERPWQVLESAAVDPLTATALLEIGPGELAVRARKRLAALVAVTAASPDTEVALAGLDALPRWAQWADQAGLDVAADHVVDLTETSTWRRGVVALVAGCDALDDEEAIPSVTGRLIAALDLEFAFRDQPARQRLAELARHLQSRVGVAHGLRPSAVRMADLLAPVATGTAIELAAAALAWEDEQAAVDGVLGIARLASRPTLAGTATQAVAAGLSGVLPRLDAAYPRRLARTLLGAGSPSGAMIALGVVQVAGREALWQEPWRGWLRDLRIHEDPDVRAAAASTFIAAE